MRAGALRRKITIETFTTAQNARGEMVKTWVTFLAAVPAEMVPNNGRETIQGGAPNANQPVIVRTRYIAGVTPSMRLDYLGRKFEIQSVANINERNRSLEMTCIERQ